MKIIQMNSLLQCVDCTNYMYEIHIRSDFQSHREVQQKVEYTKNQFSGIPLWHDDLFPFIFSFLPITDLTKLRTVSKEFYDIVRITEVEEKWDNRTLPSKLLEYHQFKNILFFNDKTVFEDENGLSKEFESLMEINSQKKLNRYATTSLELYSTNIMDSYSLISFFLCCDMTKLRKLFITFPDNYSCCFGLITYLEKLSEMDKLRINELGIQFLQYTSFSIFNKTKIKKKMH